MVTLASEELMGPLFVLIFWGIVATILSAAGGAILRAIVSAYTEGVQLGRKRALTIAGFLPAACFAYLFCCVMVFSVWSASRGRDWGWGDTWDTPIAGDYHLMMIDVTDNATIYSRSDRGAYSGEGSVTDYPNDSYLSFLRLHLLRQRSSFCAPYYV